LTLSIPVVIAAISITVAVTVAVTIPTTLAAFDREISPAAVIDPDPPVIRAPTVAFRAGGFATLFYQLGSA